MSEDYYFDKNKNNKNTSGEENNERSHENTSYVPKENSGKRKKKHTATKIIFSLIAVLLVISILATAGFSAVLFASYTPAEYSDNAYVTESNLKNSASVTNILFIGQDSTASLEENTRSDSMILVSVNSINHTIKLTSFMRDLWVTIPNYGGAKLNASCQYGGPQLVCDTLESVFGIDIDGYCRVNFDVFVDVINTLGGITVPEITQDEADSFAHSHKYVETGTNVLLDGESALWYCRIRHGAGDDFGRTARQREMITLIINKAIKSSPDKLLSIAKTVLSEVEMSLSERQLISLALTAVTCLTSDIAQQQIPATGTYSGQYVNGQDALVGDIPSNTSILYEFIYGES